MDDRPIKPVLDIKINLPIIHGNVIERVDLISYLKKEIMKRPKIILLSAPPGYGKTTLLVNLLNKEKAGTLWVSLDKSDNDPISFFMNLAEGFKKINQEISASIQSIIGIPQIPGMEYIGSMFVTWLSSLQNPLNLVFDDYHFISNSFIHGFINFLLKNLPSCLNIFILTREDPPFQLARLRITHQLIELRSQQLRFNQKEMADFINASVRFDLDEHLMQMLLKKTHGWPAGLQMFLLSFQNQPIKSIERYIEDFNGSESYIIDYLFEEALADIDQEVTDFLSISALFDTFSIKLCDFITDKENSKKIIEKIKKENLFILSLDQQNQWFSFHPLFANCIKINYPVNDKSVIFKKAAIWFESNHIAAKAVKYYFLAGEIEKAVELIKTEANSTFQNGESMTLLMWLDQVPAKLQEQDPELLIFKLWALFFSDKMSEMNQILHEKSQFLFALNKTILQGRFVCLKAWLADIESSHNALSLAKEAIDFLKNRDNFFTLLAYLPYSHALVRGGMLQEGAKVLETALTLSKALNNDFITAIVLHNLLFLYNEMGKRTDGEILCKEMIKVFTQKYSDETPLVGLLYIPLASFYYEANKLSAAQEYAEKSRKLCKNLHLNYMLAERAEYSLILVHLAFSNIHSAQELLQNMAVEAGHTTFIPVSEILDSFEVEIALKSGNIKKVKDWIILNHLDGITKIESYKKDLITYIRFLIIEKNFKKAAAILKQVIFLLEKENRVRMLITAHILFSIVMKILKQEPAADESMRKAVDYAKAGYYIRVFFNEDNDIVSLLLRIKNQAPLFIEKLITELKKFAQVPKQSYKDLDELSSLSKREIEIVSLISIGLSNKDISEKLFISPGTVKWHINNIFSKLDVKNRTQALIKAKEWGLINPI